MPDHPNEPMPLAGGHVVVESLPAALIDGARISVMAAHTMFASDPTMAPLIVLPGEEEVPTVIECLGQAMQWLNAARELAAQAGPPPTSLHVIERPAAAAAGGAGGKGSKAKGQK